MRGHSAAILSGLFSLLVAGIPGTLLAADAPVLKTPRIPAEVAGTLRQFNEELSRGLNPADNAVVFLLEVVGEDALDASVRKPSLEMLGVESFPKTAIRFQYIPAFVRSLAEIAPANVPLEIAQVEAELAVAHEKLWSRADSPRLTAFLAANEAAIDAIVQAAHKPRYYAPMLSEEEPPRLLSASLGVERRLSFLARVLTARAALRFQEQRGEEAINDLMAGHRLAKLLAIGSPFDISMAKAHVVEAIVSRGAVTLLEAGRLSGDQAKAYRKALDEVGPLPDSEWPADRGERAILRQEIELLQTDGESVRDFFKTPDQDVGNSKPMPLPKIDWSAAAKRTDEVQSQVVRALATRDRQEQSALFEELDRNYAAWDSSADDMAKKFMEAEASDGKAVGRWIGEIMALSLRPVYRQRRLSDDQERIRRDMLRIALALTAYRSDHGRVPDALSALAPKYLSPVPLDAAAGQEFFYSSDTGSNSMELRSWGANGTDDAGGAYNDDVTIRLRNIPSTDAR